MFAYREGKFGEGAEFAILAEIELPGAANSAPDSSLKIRVGGKGGLLAEKISREGIGIGIESGLLEGPELGGSDSQHDALR